MPYTLSFGSTTPSSSLGNMEQVPHVSAERWISGRTTRLFCYVRQVAEILFLTYSASVLLVSFVRTVHFLHTFGLLISREINVRSRGKLRFDQVAKRRAPSDLQNELKAFGQNIQVDFVLEEVRVDCRVHFRICSGDMLRVHQQDI